MSIDVIAKILNLLIAVLMTLICFWDIKWKQIPISYIGIMLCLSIVAGAMRVASGAGSLMGLLLAAAPGLFLILITMSTQSVGTADGPILIALGLTVGAEACFVAFLVSLVLTGAFGIVMILLRKYSGRTQVPYCPFVAGAFALVLTIGL